MSLFKKTKTKEETATAAAPVKKTVNPRHLPIYEGRVLLRRPWGSEKAHLLQKYDQYVFLVNLKAKKPEIKKEIASHYGVKVAGVNIVLQKGKTKRLGRSSGVRSDFKKAIVTLAPGNKIEIT